MAEKSQYFKVHLMFLKEYRSKWELFPQCHSSFTFKYLSIIYRITFFLSSCTNALQCTLAPWNVNVPSQDTELAIGTDLDNLKLENRKEK